MNNNAEANEKIFHGDAFFYGVEMVDFDEATEIETPINIAGYTFWMTIKNKKTDTDTDALVKVVRQDPHDSPANGITSLTVSGADMKSEVLPGSYWFDIRFTDTTGEPGTLVLGNLEVKEVVTDDLTV